ncbi:hypothetical protein FAVG1_03055 [Fusarium avenaceum]|nr:hypothetical protein FAVG1_03055 [Fusarium avenaceum]
MNQINQSTAGNLATFRGRVGSQGFEFGLMTQGERLLLQLACQQWNLDMVRFLLENRNIEPEGFDVWSFILRGPMDIALALVTNSFDINQPYLDYPYSVLGDYLRNPDMMYRLLSLGASPDMTTPCGSVNIPTLAGERASVEVVDMLYHAGAKFYKSNALHRAIVAAEHDDDRFAIMDFLLHNQLVDINQLEYGYKANPNQWPGSGTALHYAVRTASLRSVEYLLAWNADLNVKNRMGWTPLDLAIRYGLEDIKRVLRDAQRRLRRDTPSRGANTSGRDNE